MPTSETGLREVVLQELYLGFAPGDDDLLAGAVFCGLAEMTGGTVDLTGGSLPMPAGDMAGLLNRAVQLLR